MHTHRNGPRGRATLALWIVLLLAGALPGCAAFTNPTANGLPVRRVPPELLAESKETKQ